MPQDAYWSRETRTDEVQSEVRLVSAVADEVEALAQIEDPQIEATQYTVDTASLTPYTPRQRATTTFSSRGRALPDFKLPVQVGYLLTLATTVVSWLSIPAHNPQQLFAAPTHLFFLQLIPLLFLCWCNWRLHAYIKGVNPDHPISGRKAALMSLVASPISSVWLTAHLGLLFSALSAAVLILPTVVLAVLASIVVCIIWWVRAFGTVGSFIDKHSRFPGKYGSLFTALITAVPITITQIWGMLTIVLMGFMQFVSAPGTMPCPVFINMVQLYAVSFLVGYGCSFWALSDVKHAIDRVNRDEP